MVASTGAGTYVDEPVRSQAGPESGGSIPAWSAGDESVSEQMSPPQDGVGGSGGHESVTAPVFGEPEGTAVSPADDGPDAFAKGWAVLSSGREAALFVLDGKALGIGPADSPHQPRWIDLTTVTALDAIGDPVGGVLEVEMVLDDGDTISAGWPDHFTDPLLRALHRAAGREDDAGSSTESSADEHDRTELGDPGLPPSAWSVAEIAPAEPDRPTGGAALGSSAAAPVASVPDVAPPLFGAGLPPAPAGAEPAAAEQGPEPVWASEAPGTRPVGTALVLEDVVYLGGYPGQTKKRKKCVATLTREGMEVTGPSGLAFHLAWDAVRTVEAQNADEARFRMNTKIHRDATALVIECQQDVTVLLEARDCPTVPLRSAITTLVDGLRVVVV
jgi:hypothetical protein